MGPILFMTKNAVSTRCGSIWSNNTAVRGGVVNGDGIGDAAVEVFFLRNVNNVTMSTYKLLKTTMYRVDPIVYFR